uniref:Uncharacterized protein n=1 Tax=Haemonchus placei TaxID=6290 RepID=A0A0N4VWM2_HAEPC
LRMIVLKIQSNGKPVNSYSTVFRYTGRCRIWPNSTASTETQSGTLTTPPPGFIHQTQREGIAE